LLRRSKKLLRANNQCNENQHQRWKIFFSSKFKLLRFHQSGAKIKIPVPRDAFMNFLEQYAYANGRQRKTFSSSQRCFRTRTENNKWHVCRSRIPNATTTRPVVFFWPGRLMEASEQVSARHTIVKNDKCLCGTIAGDSIVLGCAAVRIFATNNATRRLVPVFVCHWQRATQISFFF
jgi:hypothetical protein